LSTEFSISTFDINLFRELTALFSEQFDSGDRLLSAVYSEWLYSRNPFGLAEIVTAEQDGSWLGFMALVPICLARQDEVKIAYFVVNVLVHPKQRGKGIFGFMIDKAIEYVKNKRAILMGHPNSVAYRAWERAAMHFQPPLKSYFVIPKCVQWNTTVHEVGKASELRQFINQFNGQGQKSQEWRVILSEDYLEWRYLQHPKNNYCLRAINVKKGTVGVIVTKKLRSNVNMLIDQFALNGHVDTSFGCAPWLTVAFLPQACRQDSGRLWGVPLAKGFPFFCTDYEKPIGARELTRLGLSASDF
jgi:GNAT superfamily N-acetyltransferase